MTAARLPACFSSIMSYLPDKLPRRANSEARPTDASNPPLGDQILTGNNPQDEDERQKDKQHLNAASIQGSTLCQDAAEHASPQNPIGFGRSMKVILHKAFPSKVSVFMRLHTKLSTDSFQKLCGVQ